MVQSKYPKPASGEDPLYQKAVELLRRQKQSSASDLQSRLGIGFARARALAIRLGGEGVADYDPTLRGNTLILKGETRKTLSGDSDFSPLLKVLKRAPKNFESLCDGLGCSPAKCRDLIQQARNEGHVIGHFESGQIYYSEGAQQIRQERMPMLPVKDHFAFGACADLHLGSKAEMPEEFQEYVELIHKSGVREIVLAGDLFDGIKVYKGQDAEVRLWGLDAQLEHGKQVLPRKPGLTYHTIGGNHDASFIARADADILALLQNSRPDFIHHGNYAATFPLHGLVVELHHGAGGGAYALSYLLQRYIDAIPGGSKPQFLIQGHYHNAFEMFYRNVFAYHPGCFQGETLFTKRYGLHPAPGGYMIEVWTDAQGGIRKVRSEFFPFYFSTKVVIP